jgi:hypothetical protein
MNPPKDESRMNTSTPPPTDATSAPHSRYQVILTTLLRLLSGFVVILALIFLPAGTWDYWQAWLWLAALFVPMLISLFYLVKGDPTLLERRTRTRVCAASRSAPLRKP